MTPLDYTLLTFIRYGFYAWGALIVGLLGWGVLYLAVRAWQRAANLEAWKRRWLK